jgi:hypothetical protein
LFNSQEHLVIVCAVAALLVVAARASATPSGSAPLEMPTIARSDDLSDEEHMLRELIAQSFPTLAHVDIRLKGFHSDSDYFRTSFSARRFAFGMKMQYVVLVNREWRSRGAPIDGVRSILAHELAHVEDLSHGKRIGLLRLVGLASPARTARFERRADLTAMARGYGGGLEAYRAWLYGHIPESKIAEKKRDYFSPEEIAAALAAAAGRPTLFDCWIRDVPLTLGEIQAARCPDTPR